MFKFAYNIVATFLFSLLSMILVIVTGKQPKVSCYHNDLNSHNSDVFDICNDKYIKTNHQSNVSPDCKRLIIDEYLRWLGNDKKFTDIANGMDFPIHSGNEIIGTQSYFSVMDDIKTEFINNLKKCEYDKKL